MTRLYVPLQLASIVAARIDTKWVVVGLNSAVNLAVPHDIEWHGNEDILTSDPNDMQVISTVTRNIASKKLGLNDVMRSILQQVQVFAIGSTTNLFP